MASIPTRKEPVLEEQRDADDDGPLLLTHLLRQGLPPQLWRRTDDATPEAITYPAAEAAEASPDHLPSPPPESVTAPESPAVFSMRWEEAAAAALKSAATAHTEYAQAEPHWLDTVAAASPFTAQKDIEKHELDVVLARIREAAASTAVDDTVAASPMEATSAPLAAVVPSSEKIADAMVLEQQSAPVPPAASEPLPEQGAEKAGAPQPVQSTVPTPPVDLDFLKDFEDLLFQEIERRIINEIEDLVTQHLQTVWKEQVSLTIMRTLALEGIKLRESLAGDIRKSLPEILQRVLHEGLDQINASEIE